MSLAIQMAKETVHQPRIMVIGCGGGGGNAVENMISGSLQGATFAVANTDLQVLMQHPAEVKIQLGKQLTEGLGAGANPDVGAAAAEESYDDICEVLRGSHMVFLTCGMGGGTGTGATPVIARAARELGILTVAVVTKPFTFEGARRMRQAETGIEELKAVADTVIVIPNQNLFRIATERTTLQEAFKMADNVLYQGVRGVTDLMLDTGLINLDFNDVKTVMSEMGQAMMGTGEAEGEQRAIMAAEMAISSPLLDGISMQGARGVLINVTGGEDLTLYEVDEAANRIREEVDPDANIIFGTAYEKEMTGKIRVSVVATGLGAPVAKKAAAQVSLANVKAKVEAPPMMEEPKAEVRDFATAAKAKAEREEETRKESSMWDDLEIPAFLRRQAN
ncbi:MAG: cell division protein FtsZ [Pseudomonadaceae bacterium]|nr:cell division protein FtsZ [Pseudomonadaceae bacterium]